MIKNNTFNIVKNDGLLKVPSGYGIIFTTKLKYGGRNMKKIIAFLLTILFVLSFTSCSFVSIEVVENNGTAQVNRSAIMPKVILTGEPEIEIKDKSVFEKLVSAIDGKPIIKEERNYDCLYNIRIDLYDFQVHSSGIAIYKRLGHNIRGVETIGTIECTANELDELCAILKNIKETNN